MAVSTKQHEETNQTPTDMAIDLAERLESVKAGLTGAFSAGLINGGMVGLAQGLSHQVPGLGASQFNPDSLHLLINLGIVLLSGFLFGVTYRYVIRQDKNSHLGDGAVLAFGLVRGLAQLQATLDWNRPPLPYVLMVVASVTLFAITRIVLDWALGQGWVKPFRSN